jgi:ketopantoate reductase
MENIFDLIISTAKELRTWISDQKTTRREELNTTVEKGTTTEFQFSKQVSEYVRFHDGEKDKSAPHASPRTFSLVVVQMDIIQGNSNIKDVKAHMTSYMSEIAAWYKPQLDRHVEEHFARLEKVIERCEIVANAMNDHFGKIRKERKPVNGTEMYASMIQDFSALKG